MTTQDARICCLDYAVEILDLGFSMRRGEVKIVDATRAKASRDMMNALRDGHISVRYIPKPRIEPAAKEQPSPPWLRRYPTGVEPRATADQKLTLEDIREVVSQEMDSRLEGLREEIRKIPAPPPSETVSTPPVVEDADDMPLFIPSTIIEGDERVDPDMSEGSASAIDSAQAALRSLKRKG